MKSISFKLFIAIVGLSIAMVSCFNQTERKEPTGQESSLNDTTEVVQVPFKNSPSKIEYEVSVKKGTKVMHGIRKRFYPHGSVYSEINYKNGKRNGLAYTYYQAYGGDKPQVWKEQLYVNGQLDGTCRRFHKNGKIQAEYDYKEGLPGIGFKEWDESGKEINLPELILSKEVINHQTYVTASMSNKTKNVAYYVGPLVDGKYISKNKLPLLLNEGRGELTIPHTSTQKSVTITAELTSKYRNSYYVSKTLKLE